MKVLLLLLSLVAMSYSWNVPVNAKYCSKPMIDCEEKLYAICDKEKKEWISRVRPPNLRTWDNSRTSTTVDQPGGCLELPSKPHCIVGRGKFPADEDPSESPSSSFPADVFRSITELLDVRLGFVVDWGFLPFL
ncbi:hypothetical protein GE061_019739 [Apolygus lucorum]|uniref:Secreted protein n=1 Tax=Apolygus lucorum TaxID=248454 RepID=A0A8S9XBX4_APOLU|nr:hypothetical protein GE061_019739 [Apolygus lucorum]